MRKKDIYKILNIPLVNLNDCKYLHGESKRRFFIQIRDRCNDQKYFLITFKGNYIRAYQIRYVNQDGEGINTFTEMVIPRLTNQKVSTPIYEKKLLCKYHFREYKAFFFLFKQLTPSLQWDERPENNFRRSIYDHRVRKLL